MEVKYQVFVSSTYKDLLEERQEVMQALLELDCIPVGMELFPATDDDQWTLIKRLIDDCDYYILIVGGRYGSINTEGISYTQMEYDYALNKGIPIISFLHKKPENITVGKSENEKELKKKLESFKELVQQKTCKYYESPIELGSIVSRSLVRLTKDKPQPGWVKSTFLPSEETTKEILELTKQVELLKGELEKVKTKAPEGSENLSQGSDTIKLNFSFTAREKTYENGSVDYTSTSDLTWNEIFGEISPLMIDETPERPILNSITKLIRNKEYKRLEKEFKKEERYPTDFNINYSDYQTIKIQLRALNLMTESIRKRGVRDTTTYWTLTPFGDTVMTRLRAIKR
ncbi:DUF4062 domain-containing protein [Tenacibaculum finnmarkense]|uniref:DUF4062 domain-containing protein n=1 Tax=Tenacibaculum finnmarkense TaxID=2781243 RepID=UPI00187BA75D|nr:DUF4062 domain-containing protein [Tenacibaculum finnmarkense]MBE7661230.1 DUF4062 domain-containing protein [Tenacibaculum finnmarkense genomovar finnmarkense]MCG8253161.1 DUF4062 domain-containing protein [Tenacibaculum finnmarkense genomovar finnmarkense]MCG8816552.1 DUF4062 domain-containing protein [Tenacibaculum finnmarkense]